MSTWIITLISIPHVTSEFSNYRILNKANNENERIYDPSAYQEKYVQRLEKISFDFRWDLVSPYMDEYIKETGITEFFEPVMDSFYKKCKDEFIKGNPSEIIYEYHTITLVSLKDEWNGDWDSWIEWDNVKLPL